MEAVVDGADVDGITSEKDCELDHVSQLRTSYKPSFIKS